MELIWFCLSAFGLTQILVYGKIFDKHRPAKDDFGGFGELFHCPMCMGFWVGIFLFSINGLTELFTFDYNIVNAMICGWVSSAVSYVLNMLFGDSGLNLNFGEKNEKYMD
jgi:hypothetical protein